MNNRKKVNSDLRLIEKQQNSLSVCTRNFFDLTYEGFVEKAFSFHSHSEHLRKRKNVWLCKELKEKKEKRRSEPFTSQLLSTIEKKKMSLIGKIYYNILNHLATSFIIELLLRFFPYKMLSNILL